MNKRTVLILVRIFFATSLLTATGLGQSQEKILYSFCSAANCTDGASPEGRLVSDSAGNLYGTTAGGGTSCESGSCGTAFELISEQNGTWTHTVLHNFGANTDGSTPEAGLIFDKAGNLYGTTTVGGTLGLGTVFQLTPPVQQGGDWTESVLWSFGGSGDGHTPQSDLVVDAFGNIYGTTSQGGAVGYGTVFQLVPPSSGGQWSENILFSFGSNPLDGGIPKSGVTFDDKGNVYGATYEGGANQGYGLGVIYELSPAAQLPWTETVLFRFTKSTGGNSVADLNFDKLGNLYGTATSWSGGYGSVFRLALEGGNKVDFLPFSPPAGEFPAAGILIVGNAAYGTAELGGASRGGTVFKIQGAKEAVLYSFCSQPQCTDGSQPMAAVITDKKGNLYGTTVTGGANINGGVVFEIPKAAH